MDNNTELRSCSIPGIPYVREWVERWFGDLCAEHDEAYADNRCRVCVDIRFFGRALGRCLPYTVVLIALPFVFIGFQINNIYKKISGNDGE